MPPIHYHLLLSSVPSEIGAHILSGNVFDPKALKELLPDIGDDWTTALKDAQSSHATLVSEDKFLVLTEDSSYSIPTFLFPSQLHNDGNYVISLGQLCRWLGGIAEEMGVEVYPGFAASEVVFDEEKRAVRGIATRDVGIGKVRFVVCRKCLELLAFTVSCTMST
jgi:electron-transferring-flavoprotein dehydrogenase